MIDEEWVMTRKKKILIVDDSVFICISMRNTLNNHDYAVSYTRSGEAALKLLSTNTYDLIYLDMIMPGMNGVETCRLIKKSCPETKLVFMTGCYDDILERRTAFVNAGGEDYCLYKPFTSDEVLLSAATLLINRE